MLKRGGTRLSTIQSHTLWVWCQCGHRAGVPVAQILQLEHPPETVGAAVDALRCTRCKTRSICDYRISYEGGSWDAMSGGDMRSNPDK